MPHEFLRLVINPNSSIDIGSEEVEFPVCLSIVADHVVLGVGLQ